MSETHPYRTGIITSIVAAAIWSVVPGWRWTFHLLQVALPIFRWQIPFWLILIFVGIAAVLWFMMGWRIHIRSSKTSQLDVVPSASNHDEIPDYCDYDEDQFFGIVWRWYYNNAHEPVKPVSFCPTCDMQLVIHQSHGGYRAAGIITTYLLCERCDEYRFNEPMKYRDLQGRIIREIQRKIRSGEYKRLLT